jgi:hypothetical protein
MEAPQILLIEKYSQNMLLSATLIEQVFNLFKFAQTVGSEAVKWIEEAKRWCNILGSAHNWIWPYSSIAKPLRFPILPLLEGQGLIMVGSNLTFKTEVQPSRPSSPDLSKALILHPVHSNFARAHPEYNPFTSLNNIPDLLTYSDKDLLANDLLAHLSISMESLLVE